MPKGRRLGTEQVVTKVRQIEVMQGQGKSIAVACKEAGTTEQSYYRWRKEYGGLNVEQAKRLKQLEDENGRLNKLVADLSLEKQVLSDIARGKL
jgi:putative transposase